MSKVLGCELTTWLRTSFALVLTCVLAKPAWAADLPARYFQLMQAELTPIEARLQAEPNIGLAALETGPNQKHFPGAILAEAVLYAKQRPANTAYGDKRRLAFALQIGDLLARENEKGLFQRRQDDDWDMYMWLEAFPLLEPNLGTDRQERWRRELEKNVREIAANFIPRIDFPRYQGPFIRTSTNHYSLWASTAYLVGRMFHNQQWIDCGAKAMHRLAAEEQTPDGYWGEHTDNGPTTGYNYLTMTGVALYWEHSGDPAALEALRRATNFHENFTYPDGTPVETNNGRSRFWDVSAWGQFGFSHLPNGRRCAEFLTGFFREGKLGNHALGRIAQDALYYHVAVVACRHVLGSARWRIAGEGQASLIAAYAALYEPAIAEVVLVNLPPSHQPHTLDEANGPPLLNVLRVLDVPEALGCLAPRRLELIGASDPAFDRTATIYRLAGAADHLQR